MPRSCLQIDENLIAKSVVEKIEIDQTGNQIVVMNDPERDGQQRQQQKGWARRLFAAHHPSEIEDEAEHHMRPAHRDDEHFVALLPPDEAAERERAHGQKKRQKGVTKRHAKRRDIREVRLFRYWCCTHSLNR